LSNQVKLTAEPRPEKGKGPTGTPAQAGAGAGILYGYEVEPTSVSVDALELYHALHTEAGRNVLIRLEVGDEAYLTVARDVQHHPIRGETLHVDFLAVDRDAQIAVEIPVHLVDEDDAAAEGIVNQVLYTVPAMVKPMEVPNFLELSVAGMEIGDVKRVEDLRTSCPPTPSSTSTSSAPSSPSTRPSPRRPWRRWRRRPASRRGARAGRRGRGRAAADDED
jgi:large subunit ribosomal protein L25